MISPYYILIEIIDNVFLKFQKYANRGRFLNVNPNNDLLSL